MPWICLWIVFLISSFGTFAFTCTADGHGRKNTQLRREISSCCCRRHSYTAMLYLATNNLCGSTWASVYLSMKLDSIYIWFFFFLENLHLQKVSWFWYFSLSVQYLWNEVKSSHRYQEAIPRREELVLPAHKLAQCYIQVSH